MIRVQRLAVYDMGGRSSKHAQQIWVLGVNGAKSPPVAEDGQEGEHSGEHSLVCDA